MKRVLLVDDEYLILYSLSSTLKADGYAVTAVLDGASAMQQLESQDFEVCFLDVNLPDASGLDIMKLVRKRSRSTGIVIMTAAELTERQLAAIRDNGGYFLPKPFNIEQVRALARESVSAPD